MEQLERVVHSGDRVEVGAFRCPPARPDFTHAGPIRDHCVFVFPRTSVRIRHEGKPAFTADPAVVTFYNPGQPYTREPLDPAGDVCEWFALDPALAADVVRGLDERAGDRADAPIVFSHGPSDGATYLAQRELFLLLARGDGVDALAVEENVLLMLERLLGLAYAAWHGTALRPQPLRPREREAAWHARELLGLRFRDALSLGHLSRAVGLSRYRLCRAFHQAEGTTMHAFRDQLRLRAALDPLAAACDDITALALDLGYSSHSHFTANFRKAFGATPSQARTRLRSPGRR